MNGCAQRDSTRWATCGSRTSRSRRPRSTGSGMSLVRVTAVGICGSDLHWWDEGAIGDAKLTHPLVLGHEGAGVIADGPRRGERVAIDPAIPDETCRACRDGYRNLCYHIKFSGHGDTDGMLREVMAWPSHLLHPLPDGVSDADGAVLEPLGVAIHSVDLGHLPFAGTASVIGCGPIGLLLIQLLKVAGARSVLAVEPLAHRQGGGRTDGRRPGLRAHREPRPRRAWTWRSRRRATTRASAGHGLGPARRPGGAGRHPGRRRHQLRGLARAAQGADDRDGAADERGVPAGDQPGRAEGGGPRVGGDEPVRAGRDRGRVRGGGPAHRAQGGHRTATGRVCGCARCGSRWCWTAAACWCSSSSGGPATPRARAWPASPRRRGRSWPGWRAAGWSRRCRAAFFSRPYRCGPLG